MAQGAATYQAKAEYSEIVPMTADQWEMEVNAARVRDHAAHDAFIAAHEVHFYAQRAVEDKEREIARYQGPRIVEEGMRKELKQLEIIASDEYIKKESLAREWRDRSEEFKATVRAWRASSLHRFDEYGNLKG